jgi:chemotaxis protein methyltransferase CheR
MEIGIVDTRNAIRIIQDIYQYDFSDFALSSFKRRLERIIDLHNMKYCDTLVTRLREDRKFFDQFLFELTVDSTEMFRDPSLWRLLRDELFPRLFSSPGNLKIWLPSCVSGDELYSLIIVLKESGWLERAEITASCLSERSIETIRSGLFKLNKLDVSKDNYQRFQGNSSFSDYYTRGHDQAFRNPDLVKNVTFFKQDLGFANSPHPVDMIIFRNQLLYYNQGLQDKITASMYNCLVPGGYLITGVRERVNSSDEQRLFRLVSEHESIYRKK